MAGPMYQPSRPLGLHLRRVSGGLWASVRSDSDLKLEEKVRATEKDPVINEKDTVNKDTENYDRSQVIKDWKIQYDDYSTIDVPKKQKVSWGQMVEKIVKKDKG